MCGIAGFASAEALGDSSPIIRRMADVISHRGPDDAGYYCDANVALGHRRLSIIDLAGGHQPMTNETGMLQIVYNGEIFNHAELRRELERLGHRYLSHCDTETIVHAYEEFGPGCLKRFRGMFAFALWDKRARQLFCARDRLGKKPFYYFWDGELFVFGSEIKALLAYPTVSARLNSKQVPEYLAFGYLSGEETLFEGIKKLLPGHYLQLDLAGSRARLNCVEYWDVEPVNPLAGGSRSDADWISQTRRRIEDAVRSRLMSDVPLGMFLSGGVDSSAIAAIAKNLTGGRLKTFSVGYGEERYSELSHARQVADWIGTDHHEVRIGYEEFFAALPKLIWHEDEPITWASSVSLYFVSKLASEHVKVVLTGEGSDELFGGYERYRWNLWNARGAALYSHLPAGIRRRVRNFVASSKLLRADLRRKLGHTFFAREDSVQSLYLDNFYCAFGYEQARRLLGVASNAIYDNYLHTFGRHPKDSLLARMLYADQKTYLVELLMKQDQMSMAASIESRVPLLDHELVEFAGELPDHLKVRGGVQKYVFKKAVEDLLPKEIVYRKKMGFPTPLQSWLRDPRSRPLYSMLRDGDGLLASLVDQREVERLVERHLNDEEDATDRIWRLLNLQLWGDVFVAGRSSPAGQCGLFHTV